MMDPECGAASRSLILTSREYASIDAILAHEYHLLLGAAAMKLLPSVLAPFTSVEDSKTKRALHELG